MICAHTRIRRMGVTHSVQAIKIRRNGELVLLAEYRTFLVSKCPDFAHVRCMITPAIQTRVLSSWEAIANGTTPAMRAIGHTSPVVCFYDSFYKRLFAGAPEVQPLFRTSIIVQGKALISIVQTIANGPNSNNAIASVVELAYRHNQYGVKMQYYNVVGRVLLEALQECTGPSDWTADLDLGWRTVYAYMMTTMAPIVYHGATNHTDCDRALAKRGRYQQKRTLLRPPTVHPVSTQTTTSSLNSLVPESKMSECPVKNAWSVPP
ncbi:hypothetical protein H310_01810 [Aphanomyces invadans]|uniref:Globin domain-containing protein n=1 Tax=Aphanomyces invadans TaxID=157072 RepID=A0A024ULB6_9STRA|nr:hypothetical protein H310_01810 [Aphanomyces invadans]ETW07246.1 hypothetical protein H310_01810 [Aphanomyces invadans]|eukprot:XP_008863339.1 hypothetical protein H310_01810 [Aphanomyces invadans]